VLVELETDKVTVEVTASGSGVLSRILKPDGATVTIGELLGVIAEKVEEPAMPLHDGAGARVSATPVARRLAETRGVDIAAIPGSGPGGRVTKDDVIRYGAGEAAPLPTEAVQAVTHQARPAPAPALQPAPVLDDGRREERIRMTRRRQTIAARLVEAQRTAAMLTTFNEIDMSAVIDLRKRHRESFRERHGVGLGFMSFFTRAVIGALKAFPLLNAEIRGDEIIVKHYYDIGIAVSTDEGLVVPVLRNADRLSFAEIERGIEELARRARESKLTIADLQGGTFTITNGGIFGSLMSTPILNAPQVGILGMHKIQERPVALNGQVVIRPMMYVALSYDHRIIDGREAVSFLVRVKELVEDPERLLLEG
jgi:2-oxoglutarate dehydrogenase E2 component (dihydrolipoamide succinyltransferase)